MAFDIKYLARVNTSANDAVQKMWAYNGTVNGTNEAVATIVAAGYFNNAQQSLSKGLGLLSVNDLLLINGNDASGFYMVTAVTPTVILSAFAVSAPVGTANIQDLAVTTAKLDDEAVTNIKLADGAVTSDKIDANLIQYAAVPVSAAQFNGMYAAPVELVAAAGADTLLVLDKVLLAMTYDSAAYANGGVVHVQYDDTVNGAGVIASTTLAAASFQDTESTVYTFNAGVVEYPVSSCANTGLYLSNVTAAFDTGDSDFTAHVWFKVISLV